MPAERPSERLRRATEPDWGHAVAHRFAAELADGTIGDDVLRRYLVQDYQFLDDFVALLGATIHSAPALPQRVALGRFLGMVVSDENTYFQRSFDALGVPANERERPRLLEPTEGFRTLMREAAGSGEYARMIAVLTVAEWVYLSWAAPLAERKPEWFVLREWIELHSGPEFEAWVEFLRLELDRETDRAAPTAAERIESVFRRAVSLERAFFDAAYGG
jgi:thiaminase/transcriptional activator TenA